MFSSLICPFLCYNKSTLTDVVGEADAAEDFVDNPTVDS